MSNSELRALYQKKKLSSSSSTLTSTYAKLALFLFIQPLTYSLDLKSCWDLGVIFCMTCSPRISFENKHIIVHRCVIGTKVNKGKQG